MAERSPSLQVNEESIVYACRVLDSLAEAFDRIAAQPELAPQLVFELVQKAPEILDSLLAITQPDCRVVLYDLSRKVLNAVGKWTKTKKPLKKP